jgi:hypothetical protein
MPRPLAATAFLALLALTSCSPPSSSGEGEGGEGEGVVGEGEGAAGEGEGEGALGEGEGEGAVGEGEGEGAATWTATYALVVAHGCDGCHSSPTLAGNLDMGSQSTAYAQLVGVVSDGPFCGQSPHTRVVAGDADHSLLYEKLAGTQDCGFSMPYHEGPGPPGPGPFTAGELQTVHDWIAAGALDN